MNAGLLSSKVRALAFGRDGVAVDATMAIRAGAAAVVVDAALALVGSREAPEERVAELGAQRAAVVTN